eukprot:403346623
MEDKSRETIYDNIFGQLLKGGNAIHTIYRAVNYFLITWLMLVLVDLSLKANVNVGIMVSIISISVIFVTLLSNVMFREKISGWSAFSIIVIISGVVTITISRDFDKSSNVSQSQELNGDTVNVDYMFSALGVAILVGLLNTTRVLQAKYLNMKSSYEPIQFSIDSALTCGTIQFLFCIYYVFQNHEGYTLYNWMVSFFAGVLMQINSFTSLYAVVKGLAAPAGAIVNTHSMWTTIYSIIIYGMFPNLYQYAGMGLILGGVLISILLHKH